MVDQRFEQAFVDAFAHITDQPRPVGGIDPRSIVGRGASSARSHPNAPKAAVRWLAGAAASLVVAALVWSVLGPGRPLAGVPVPVASPSRDAVNASVRLDFDVDASLPYAGVTIDVARRDGRLTVEVTATEDGEAPRVVGTFLTRAGEFWSTSVDEDLQVALVPGETRSAVSLNEFDLVHLSYVGQLGMTAVAVERAAGQPADGLIWLDAGGQVRNSLGLPVPGAALRVDSYTVVVFRDEGLGVWGYFDVRGGVQATRPLASEPTGALVGVSATVVDDHFYESIWIGMLPAGGTDPEPVLDQPGIRWATGPVGDTGRVAFMVFANRIKKGQRGIESITYTTAGGERVSYVPELR